MARDNQAEFENELYQLRVIGRRTWRDIGAALGMSHEQARRRFHKQLGRGITDEDRENYRNEETEKLDKVEEMYRQVAEKAMNAKKLHAGTVFAALDGMGLRLVEPDRIGLRVGYRWE